MRFLSKDHENKLMDLINRDDTYPMDLLSILDADNFWLAIESIKIRFDYSEQVQAMLNDNIQQGKINNHIVYFQVINPAASIKHTSSHRSKNKGN